MTVISAIFGGALAVILIVLFAIGVARGVMAGTDWLIEKFFPWKDIEFNLEDGDVG